MVGGMLPREDGGTRVVANDLQSGVQRTYSGSVTNLG
jgi:hypothetical protein